MTTPEQIIAKIEEIEKLMYPKPKDITTEQMGEALFHLLRFKQVCIRLFNLPTSDPPEGSPGQEDMEG